MYEVICYDMTVQGVNIETPEKNDFKKKKA